MGNLSLSAFSAQKGDDLLQLTQRKFVRPCWGPWFAVLANAARTTTSFSGIFSIPSGVGGLFLCVEVSAAGTSSLTPFLIAVGQDDVTTNSWITSSTGITSVIRRFIQISPGSGTLSGMTMANYNSFVAAYIWPKWAIGITHGDGSSWTYRVDGKYLYL